MMKTVALCSVLLLLAPLSSAAPVPKGAQSANLVVNGSFEDGPAFEVCQPVD
jgi:choice-of-anchor C domain-containing protein